ncbi:hypothetical protein TOPH_03706 [Tolypocladium ophioglossoides CBS 100239]|uniref:RNase MRP protein 1 RNA binding domain-containing protein n=1 Tax=Tolypocladium ophioglossoides (strain CBS 100239) TaxID=1163406 RepID=A0A0L0NC12_TOLOC|nr:hypothetical protein TOPH_03706 [Tolypocladium ophioglossoides CBS 100239]
MTTSYAHAGDSLSALLPLLHAFNHRHRNQHRASHWWSSFNILRRALQAVADDVLQPNSRPPPPATTTARRRDDVVARAGWLRSHIVPRAYVAFTQLAADNQHAPLGLMLLAVLGRTNTILADLAPSESHPPQSSKSAEQPLTKILARTPSTAESRGLDRGVTISRRDIQRADEESAAAMPGSRKRAPEEPFKHGHDSKTSNDGETKAKDKKKKKKKDPDALSSLFSSLA